MIAATHDLFRWLKENHVKTNPDKYHLLVTTNVLISVKLNGFQKTTPKKNYYVLSLIVNTLLKTMSQVSVRRQVKNYMR